MSPHPDPPPNPPIDPGQDPAATPHRNPAPLGGGAGHGWGPPPPGWDQWRPASEARPPGPAPGAPFPEPAAKPGVLELRPLGFADLLDATFAVVRRAPLPTVVNAVLVQLIPALLSLILLRGLAAAMLALERLVTDQAGLVGSRVWEPDAWAGVFNEPWQFYAGAGATLLVVQLLANVLVIGPSTVASMRAVLGMGTGWGQGLALSSGAMVRIAGWNLLLGLGAVLALGLLGALVLLLAANLGTLAAVLGSLALILVLLPVLLWIGIRLSLVQTLLVTRPPGILRAITSSWSLARGSWWRILGILLVVAVVLGILGGLLSQLASAIGGELAGAHDGFGTLVTLSVVVNALVGAVGMVLAQLMLVMLHVDLRIRKERLDMALATEALDPASHPIPGYRAPRP